jgi:hypothetical protein
MFMSHSDDRAEPQPPDLPDTKAQDVFSCPVFFSLSPSITMKLPMGRSEGLRSPSLLKVTPTLYNDQGKDGIILNCKLQIQRTLLKALKFFLLGGLVLLTEILHESQVKY